VLGTTVHTACRELDGFLPRQFSVINAGAQVWNSKLAHATYAVRAMV
jgi:hypothetical protein